MTRYQEKAVVHERPRHDRVEITLPPGLLARFDADGKAKFGSMWNRSARVAQLIEAALSEDDTIVAGPVTYRGVTEEGKRIIREVKAAEAERAQARASRSVVEPQFKGKQK